MRLLSREGRRRLQREARGSRGRIRGGHLIHVHSRSISLRTNSAVRYRRNRGSSQWLNRGSNSLHRSMTAITGHRKGSLHRSPGEAMVRARTEMRIGAGAIISDRQIGLPR